MYLLWSAARLHAPSVLKLLVRILCKESCYSSSLLAIDLIQEGIVGVALFLILGIEGIPATRSISQQSSKVEEHHMHSSQADHTQKLMKAQISCMSGCASRVPLMLLKLHRYCHSHGCGMLTNSR